MTKGILHTFKKCFPEVSHTFLHPVGHTEKKKAEKYS
jgi:hypothetical protein